MSAGSDSDDAGYLHRLGTFFGFFGLGYLLYCIGRATRRMEASVLAALLRAAIAGLGGYAVIWLAARSARSNESEGRARTSA